uniref:ARAD1C31350p n=1 Tax=Blastobotrys adeninivorans TaxID=409370 RepID=A0A060T3B0_BLAAD
MTVVSYVSAEVIKEKLSVISIRKPQISILLCRALDYRTSIRKRCFDLLERYSSKSQNCLDTPAENLPGCKLI